MNNHFLRNPHKGSGHGEPDGRTTAGDEKTLPMARAAPCLTTAARLVCYITRERSRKASAPSAMARPVSAAVTKSAFFHPNSLTKTPMVEIQGV